MSSAGAVLPLASSTLNRIALKATPMGLAVDGRVNVVAPIDVIAVRAVQASE